jgi:NCS1 family nucleobase:cation symporter-1
MRFFILGIDTHALLDVFQLEVRQRLPYRIPDCWAQCVWNVGCILFRGRESSFGDSLVRCSAILWRLVSQNLSFVTPILTIRTASLLANVLRAIFGHNYTDIPNSIPASQGITSAGMLAFFLFWLMHLPFTALRPYQLKWLFNLKIVTMIPAVFGLFIFCMVNTNGRIGAGHLTQTSASTGGWGWFFVYSINAGMGNTATLITNQPDYARWSKTKTGAMWSQLIANPISVTLAASLGILSTAAINNAWGLQLWNQWDLFDAIMDRYWSGSTRFAVFLAASAWTISILGTNIAANMIPFGSDSSMLFPRFLTIPRGQFVVLCLSFAICPWKILASATTFTTFLAGYGLFMASVVAIMICDYFLLTKGNVFLSNLYDGSSSNKHYYYHRGWNLQAVISYIVGIALPFPGFVGTLGPHVSKPAQELGQLGWLLSFSSSFVVYYVLCKIWPTRNQRVVREMGLGWEEMSYMSIVTADGTIITDDLTGHPEARSHVGGVEKRETYGI